MALKAVFAESSERYRTYDYDDNRQVKIFACLFFISNEIKREKDHGAEPADAGAGL